MSARYFWLIVFVVLPSSAVADDWPQWRGAERSARVSNFTPPATWPKELTKGWSVPVGDGVATPALVGDRLYVFTREGNEEVTRCLDAADGKELWIDKHPVNFQGRPDRDFASPRSSPAVAQGKIVTLGVNGTVSCLDASSGKVLWRKETEGFPRFHTSSSPLIVDDAVITQIGSEKKGAVVAYNLADGSEKWKWSDEGPEYASPVLMTINGTTMAVVETSASVVGLDAKDGKMLWKVPFPISGARNYNASTPLILGQTVIFSGSNRGTRAYRIEKDGDQFTAKELWNNRDSSVMYNTPVLVENVVYGLTANDILFAIDAGSGKMGWENRTKGRGGYGSIVAAGPVLFALNPTGQLTVYEPNPTEYKELASYKVAASNTYAYPVIDGKRIFVKDKDTLTMWTIE